MTRTASIVLSFLFLITVPLFSQNEIIDIIDIAKESVLQHSYQEASDQLSKALELLNEKLIFELSAAFPEPLKGWRADDVKNSKSNISNVTSLTVKRSYFKEGGGPSVDMEIVTNSMRIGSIKMLFSSPSMVKRAGNNLKISSVADRKCIERYDPIDRYAELTFVPTSTLLITIIGHDMKNIKTVTKYAERIDWDRLEEKFP